MGDLLKRKTKVHVFVMFLFPAAAALQAVPALGESAAKHAVILKFQRNSSTFTQQPTGESLSKIKAMAIPGHCLIAEGAFTTEATDEYPQRLARNRGAKTMAALIDAGVSREAISIRGPRQVDSARAAFLNSRSRTVFISVAKKEQDGCRSETLSLADTRAGHTNARAKTNEKKLSPEGAQPKIQHGKSVLTLRFERNSDDPTEASVNRLRRSSTSLSGSGQCLVVEGAFQSQQKKQFFDLLAKTREVQTFRALVEAGIPAERIVLRGPEQVDRRRSDFLKSRSRTVFLSLAPAPARGCTDDQDFVSNHLSTPTSAGTALQPPPAKGGTNQVVVTFATNSGDISADNRRRLAAMAKSFTEIKQTAGLRLDVDAFADPRGNAQYNKLLSKYRALKIYRELVRNHVPPAAIAWHYHGGDRNPGNRQSVATWLQTSSGVVSRPDDRVISLSARPLLPAVEATRLAPEPKKPLGPWLVSLSSGLATANSENQDELSQANRHGLAVRYLDRRVVDYKLQGLEIQGSQRNYVSKSEKIDGDLRVRALRGGAFTEINRLPGRPMIHAGLELGDWSGSTIQTITDRSNTASGRTVGGYSSVGKMFKFSERLTFEPQIGMLYNTKGLPGVTYDFTLDLGGRF